MASSGNFATLLGSLQYQVGVNTTYSLGNLKYQSSTAGEYSQQAATVTVNEPNHGRSTSDTVRFRDAISVGGIAATTINSASGFTITNIDTNNYSFPSGVTATITQKGGGGLASAGPTSITN